MLELSRYFARICSCFDTLILNNGVQGAICGSWQRCWGCVSHCNGYASTSPPIHMSLTFGWLCYCQSVWIFTMAHRRGVDRVNPSYPWRTNIQIPQFLKQISNFAEQFFSWKLSIFCPMNCRQINLGSPYTALGRSTSALQSTCSVRTMITRSSLAWENNGISQTGVTLFYAINPVRPSAGRVSRYDPRTRKIPYLITGHNNKGICTVIPDWVAVGGVIG